MNLQNMRNMLTRHAPLAAAIAAAGYAVEGAIVLRAPQGDDHWSASGYICEIAFAVSLVATIVAITALVAGRGRAARTGGIIAGAGMASMFVSSIASIAAGGSVLGPAFFLGLLTALAGLLVVGVAGARGSSDPWWCSPLPVAGFVLGIGLGDHGGGLIMAAAFAAVAYALATRAPAPVARVAD